jgi:cytochrome c553
MKKIILISSLLFSSFTFAAGDPVAGKAVAANCAACHGANGISDIPLWPNLAGQKAPYLSNQLKAFKSGKRVNPMMNGIAAQLSDKDIEDVSAYYATLQ